MSSERPLVTAIVPNYNYARSLGLCLRALQEQTYQPMEIVVVDDMSTDDSVSIARGFGVRVVPTGVNSGVAVARNLGAEHANGEILLFVDSDVALAPDAVANAVTMLLADDGLGAVCGTYDPDPLIRDSKIEEYRSFQQFYLLAQTEGSISTVHTNTFVIRASVFAGLGGFNPRLRHTEDQDFGLRLVRRYRSLSTSRVRGSHDTDDTLRLVLRKVYQRSRLAIPLYLMRRGLPGGFATGRRGWASMITLLSAASLAAPVVMGPRWLALPAGLLAIALGYDAGLLRKAADHKGRGFVAYVAAVNTLVNLTVAVGVVVGGVQSVLFRSFRDIYENENEVRV